MPLSTNFDVVPYYDDSQNAEANNYYKILFQPLVSVQVRELNQLQTLLQNQIEAFGDNIFQTGTIISGCNFGFNSTYSYIKINDIDDEGETTIPGNYLYMLATSLVSGVRAQVINYLNGFQSTDPNLKTLYLNYTNPGSGGEGTFVPGDTIRISSNTYSIFRVNINSSGSQYSNSDSVIFVSALIVNSISGTFSPGETLTQPSTKARAQIISIDNSVFTTGTVIYLQPLSTDLGNTALVQSAYPWNAFTFGEAVIGSFSGATGSVVQEVGQGAQAQIITDAVGRVIDVVMTDIGSGYIVSPYVTVKPTYTSTAITTGLSLTGLNYLQDVIVATVAASVGFGYAMSITRGVIYQKGYFINVPALTVVVSPYSQSPNNLSVIFQTQENIIPPEIDPDLYDNALGTPNYSAPGANRVQLLPQLTVLPTANALALSNSALILSSFSEGNPYEQNQFTVFDSINQEIAQREYETSGNFVIDPWLDTTRSSLSNVYNLSIIVDPGVGYINGYRVQTFNNFSQDVPKCYTTATAPTTIQLTYDNYIRITNLGGFFAFNLGDTINFYNEPKGFLSNTALVYTNNTSPVGNLVATASMRSLIYDSGVPGTNTAIYRLYIFNTAVESGYNFSNAMAVFYNGIGNINGIADVIQTYSATSNSYVTQTIGNNSTLIWSPSVGRIKEIASATYTYRSINSTVSVSNTGVGSVSLVSKPNELFPYPLGSSLSNINMEDDLIIIPVTNNFVYVNAIYGTFTINTTSNKLVGIATTFTTSLSVGDFIVIANGVASDPHQIVSIVSDTLAYMDSNCALGIMSGNGYHYFPPNVQVPFGNRSFLSANLNGNGAILTFNFGGRFSTSLSGQAIVAYNAQRYSVSSGAKSARRSNQVIINTATNEGGSIGPWNLGVPDVVRLTGVWLGTTDTGVSLINFFYVDNNQTTDLVGQSYLYLNPSYNNSINLQNVELLVQFDMVVISIPGFFSTDSYVGTNLASIIQTDENLSNSLTDTSITSWEIPEFDFAGNHFDMLGWIDFRPHVFTTADLSTETVNPVVNTSISVSTDWKFPLPNSQFTANVTYYLPRVDTIVTDKNGLIYDIQGSYSLNLPIQPPPNNSIIIDEIYFPAYPTLPVRADSNTINAVTTLILSSMSANNRARRSVATTVFNNAIAFNPQPQGYTMAEIGNLERRISALEYYVSLNSLEVAVAQQAIPSSISQNVNRFIYGFFADDFSTSSFANTSDPEWSATVYPSRSQCWPMSQVICLPHFANQAPSYIEFGVISQPLASYLPVVNTPANTVANTPANTVANTPVINNTPNTAPPTPCPIANNPCVWTTIGRESTLAAVLYGVNDYLYLNLANNCSGNVTLYVVAPSTPAFEIYQNNVLITTSEYTLPLTSSDVSYLDSFPFMTKPDIDYYTDLATQVVGMPQAGSLWLTTLGTQYYYIEGSGKISWNHNPALGTDYTIETISPLDQGAWWRYLVHYPIDGGNFVDCANGVNSTISVTVAANLLSNSISLQTLYNNGSLSGVTPAISASTLSYSLQFVITGLIPNATYSFFIQDINVGAICVPSGGNFGSALQSNANGNLIFDLFYYDYWMYNVIQAAGQPANSAITNYETTLQALDFQGLIGEVKCSLVDITFSTDPIRTYFITFPLNTVTAVQGFETSSSPSVLLNDYYNYQGTLPAGFGTSYNTAEGPKIDTSLP